MKLFSALKKSAIFFILLSFVLQTSACSNENAPSEASKYSQTDFLKLIPVETNLLIYANFENLKNTPFGESIKEEISKKVETEEDEDYRDFMEKTGIDFKRDVHQVWVCSMVNNDEKDSDAGAIIQGSNFDEQRILTYVKEQEDTNLEKSTYEGHTIYLDIDDNSGFTFLKKNLIAIGKQKWLHTIIDQQDGKKNILDNPEMTKYINSIQQKDQFWGVFHVDGLTDKWANKIRSESSFKGSESIEKMKSLCFYTKFSDKTDLFIKSDFTTKEEAELVAEMMSGFRAMAKLLVMDDKEAIDMLNEIKIKTDGPIVEITTKVDKSFIEKLKEKQNKFSKGEVRLL